MPVCKVEPVTDTAPRRREQLVVGIADLKVSDRPDSIIVTHALGSCIAVIVHDPVRAVGGMLHYMLPLSSISAEKAANNPAMFGDTGIPRLFERMYAAGCDKRNLVVKVAGGASPNGDKGTFDIGRRNYIVLRKIFWQNSVLIKAEDVGGQKARTVRLDVATGEVAVESAGEQQLL